MKFGFLINRKMIDHGSSDPYSKIYAIVNEMEDLGYDILYIGHHRFSDRTAFGGDVASEPSAPFIQLAAMLARSRRITMCTNIMLLPSRHPLDVAEEINTLNELSNNRFILGAGIGYKPDEFENTGWSFKTRAKRFEECLEILRLALTGKEFTYEGTHFRVPPCTVVPPPRDNKVTPLWIGAVSEPAMQRAGRLGDGWLVSFAEHLVELEDKIARYKAIAASHNRPATVCLMRDLHIAPTRAALDPNWLSNVIKIWQSYNDLGSKADRDPVANEVIFGGKAIDLEKFAPNRAIVGTPEDCIRELEQISARLNPEYLLLTPTGVPDPDQQVRELRLFAKEVLPQFRH